MDGSLAALLVSMFALLTFVPIRYPYPTQPGPVNRAMLAIGIPWSIAVFVDLLEPWGSDRSRSLAFATMAFPVLYLGVTWTGLFMRLSRRFGGNKRGQDYK